MKRFFTRLDRWEEIDSDTSGAQLTGIETELLARVLDELDNAGLAIPDLRAVRGILGEGMSEIPGELIPFVALAQHHGVPTRLLDWTTRATVAAYFAACEIVRREPTREGMLEIIAIDPLQARLACGLPKRDLYRVVHAPRASNANLHAQSGLFTVCPGVHPKTPLDKMILEFARVHYTPFIQRLRLPQTMAPELLKFLMMEGVSGRSMFPGYDGAIRNLQEARFYADPFTWNGVMEE